MRMWTFSSVHGGWTKWSDWDTCSVTCGTGLARRHRNCTNPVPERFGDHCFGDTLDVKICSSGPCASMFHYTCIHFPALKIDCNRFL